MAGLQTCHFLRNSDIVNTFRITRKNAKSNPLTPFKINTSKSVSKQRTLTPFRMNTYGKQGGTQLLLTRNPTTIPVLLQSDRFILLAVRSADWVTPLGRVTYTASNKLAPSSTAAR